MEATPLALPEVVLLKPRVFGDHRGEFFESFNAREFRELNELWDSGQAPWKVWQSSSSKPLRPNADAKSGSRLRVSSPPRAARG